MVQFLFPKLFTIFTIAVNGFGAFLVEYPFIVSAALQTIFLVIFFVINKIELSYIVNTAVFILIFWIYLLIYFLFIFYKYTSDLISEKDYNELPYPRSYLDDVLLKDRLIYIGYLTLGFVVNFANMWIYRINYYKSLNAVNIPTQTLLSQNEEDE